MRFIQELKRTHTCNELTVRGLWLPEGGEVAVTGEGYRAAGGLEPAVPLRAALSVLGKDSQVVVAELIPAVVAIAAQAIGQTRRQLQRLDLYGEPLFFRHAFLAIRDLNFRTGCQRRMNSTSTSVKPDSAAPM